MILENVNNNVGELVGNGRPRYNYVGICQYEIAKALRQGQVYNWETTKYGKISWCLDDVDINILRFFETKFPDIVYDDALTSELEFSSEPMVSPQHGDEVNLKNETSLSEYDDEEYNVISYSDLFPFNIFSVNDSKLDTDNDGDKINIKQSFGDISIEPLRNVISINIGTYARGSNKLLETSNDVRVLYVPSRYQYADIFTKWAY
ncbi:hypothetical protein Tco_1143263 [Tanacetum coccineum]